MNDRHIIIAGVDEVGRGALFGPVVAAAVILPDDAQQITAQWGVTDSKQLSGKKRKSLVTQIRAIALECHIGTASVAEIAKINILQASLLAMKRAIGQLNVEPDLCLIDGNQPIPDLPFPQETIIKGDKLNQAIACASIIAKVWRDNLIVEESEKYPEYDLAANKGYPTPRHKAALQKYGPTPLHRISWKSVGNG
ncbi:MAG: ribonuclease HII [Hormoscilla sp.]